MASISSYRTAKGDRRYEVRYRDPARRNRSRAFSVHKDALAFKLDVERRHQAGILFQAPPERFGEVAQAWLERFVIGAAGRVRPRPKTIRVAEDCLRYLAPLNDLALERVRRPHVEDLLASVATHAPRRAEMALSLLKRILKAAEERGQHVDRAIYGIRIAKAEREPRFLTWDEAEELQSWMPEYVSRIVPVAILTVLRRAEILGLRDDDIDFAAARWRSSPSTRTASASGRRRARAVGRSTSGLGRSRSSASSSSRARRAPTATSSPLPRAGRSTATTSSAASSSRPPATPVYLSSPSTTSATPAPRS